MSISGGKAHVIYLTRGERQSSGGVLEHQSSCCPQVDSYSPPSSSRSPTATTTSPAVGQRAWETLKGRLSVYFSVLGKW